MTTIVTRSGKGSPLTHTEVDTNFTNLNTAKLETAAIPLGTLQAPSVSFLNDSDTGIFCPQGGNSLAVATGGQYAITCTSTQAVGIKTANPQKALHVAGPTRVGADDATDAFLEIGEGATGNRNSYIDIVADTTYTDYGLRIIRNNTGANATSELKHRGTGALNFTTQEAAPIEFYTTNSPRVAIDSSGRLLVGTTTARVIEPYGLGTDGQTAHTYESVSDSAPGPGLALCANSTTARMGPYLYFSRSGAASVGSNTVVVNGDNLGTISFAGADGTDVRTRGAAIYAEVDGTPGANDMPGRLVFSTTPDSGSSPTTSPPAMTIKSSQEVLIGTSTITANGGILQLKSGITFPATAVAASDANTLDDYEEGTWTPTQGAGLTVVGTFTSAGHYTKVGRQVTVQGFVRGSTSVASAGGSVFCSGLPFAVQNVNDTNFIGSGADGTLTGLINIWIDRNQAGVYSVTSSAVTASIYFTGSYFTP